MAPPLLWAVLALALCIGSLALEEVDGNDHASFKRAMAEFAPLLGELSHAAPVIVVGVGLLCYFANDRSKYREEQRKCAFERCNEQLGQFLGPIQARLKVAHTAFDVMVKTYAKLAGKDANDPALLPLLEDELAACEHTGIGDSPIARPFITYTRDIAVPLHRDVLEILTQKAHLFDGHYPQAFYDYMAYVAELEVVVRRWKQGDFSVLMLRHHRFPDALHAIIADRVDAVRERLQALAPDSVRRSEPKRSRDPSDGTLDVPQNSLSYNLLPESVPSSPKTGAWSAGPQRRMVTVTA